MNQSLEVLHEEQYKTIYNNLRDSAIQRFEYSIDGLWKYLKLYIQEQNKAQFESTTPRAILREAVNLNLITEDEYSQLLDALADRNVTSHSYNKLVAENLIQKNSRALLFNEDNY